MTKKESLREWLQKDLNPREDVIMNIYVQVQRIISMEKSKFCDNKSIMNRDISK